MVSGLSAPGCTMLRFAQAVGQDMSGAVSRARSCVVYGLVGRPAMTPGYRRPRRDDPSLDTGAPEGLGVLHCCQLHASQFDLPPVGATLRQSGTLRSTGLRTRPVIMAS